MKINEYKWYGAIKSVIDDDGNRYDMDTGRITLKNGSYVDVPADDRSDMQNAVGHLLRKDNKLLSHLLGAKIVFRLLGPLVDRSEPENILALAAADIHAGKDWKDRLGPKLSTRLTEGLGAKVDDRTGAVCTSTTVMLGIGELSPVEQVHALVGNATRFECSNMDGSGYFLDTVKQPEAEKHLIKPSELKKRPGPMI